MKLVASVIVILAPLAIVLVSFRCIYQQWAGKACGKELDVLATFFVLFGFLSLGLFEFVVCFGA